MEKVSYLKKIRSRNGPSTILAYLLGIGVLETVLRVSIKGVEHISLELFYVNTLAFALFFGVVLIILKAIIPRKTVSSIIKDVSYCYWILGLLPIFSYITQGNVPENLLSSGIAGILSVVSVFVLFLLVKTISKLTLLKSVLSSSAIIAASIPIFMIDRTSLINGRAPHYELYEMFGIGVFLRTGWSLELLTSQMYHLVVVILLIENLIIYSVFANRFLKERFRRLLRSIKPFRTVHFVMVVILGVIFVRNVASEEALSLTSINHMPFVFLPALCLVLLWQFTTHLNDLYDREIDQHVHPDRPLVSDEFDRRFHMEVLLSIALISSLLSLTLGLLHLLLNFSAILLAVLYSVPPVRLRDRLYGHICVGLGSVIAFLFGVYSPVSWAEGIYLTSPTIERNIPFFPDVLSVSLLILIVLSISPLINALSDYEGDKKAGVKNVYTVIGFERGKRIVSFLIPILFISPIMLFNSAFDILFMLSLGVIAAIVFYWYEDHRPVFGLYFLVLIYLILRFIYF